MGRAPNPGAPQRVSAHVVPKAAAFSAEDDEKTTIESGGWEEEASTTVEQGEVADKVRALGALGMEARRSGSNTNITSTTGSGVSDEPTVDDQRASAALALLPPPSVARLVVTRGNDSGRSLEVRPGKTYTIGRGVDNDLVLTDITASRKHFDIRNENGSWILADRGSGNGTLINNRIEDAPFMLASGDAIEVGNTAFRFDFISSAISLPGLPREVPAQGRRDAPPAVNGRDAPGEPPRLNSEDPDSVDLATPAVGPERLAVREPPTPAGPRDEAAAQAVRDEAAPRELASGGPREVPNVPTYDGSVDDELELSTVSGKPLAAAEPPRPPVTASRPKTLPPPAPPRPRTQTGRPPVGPVGYAPLDRAGPRSQQMAVVPQPLPQQPPPPSALAAAMAPTLAPAMAPAISPMHAPVLLPQPATTLPLPQMANRPPLSPAMLDPSLGSLPTTLPGQGPPVPARGPRLPFSYPSATEIVSQHSISQIAPGNPRGPVHVTAHAGRDATSTALVQPMSYSGGQVAIAPRPQPARRLSRRTKIALGIVGLAVFAAIATLAILRFAASRAGAGEPAASPAKPPAAPARDVVAMPKADRPPTATQPAAPAAPVDKPTPPATPAPGAAQTPPPANPTSVARAPTPPATNDKPAQTAPPTPPTTPADPEPAPRRETEKVASASPIPAAPRNERNERPERNERNDKKPPRRGDVRRPDRNDRSDRTEKRPAEVAATTPRNDRKRGGRSMQDLKAGANALYKSRNFSGAASLLTSSLSGFGSDDAKELKSIAAIYTQLGRAYNVGMAPGTRPTEAYQALRRAIDYDRDVGSAYIPEMQDKLLGIATRAASSYMASHDYELAFQAVRMAESLGSKSSSNQTVRTLLEETASDLYRAASSEMSTDPEGARKKLRQILGIVDTRNPLYARAQKLLNSP